jgi:peptidoglycan/LPS O-acetylase OafA/YrhL
MIRESTPRRGNFDAIRLVAASAVIFGHSFVVVEANAPYLFRPIAVCAVETFFIISGYLVTQSFERSSCWHRFALARSLRIFPGLVGCILFSAFVLGPALTKLTLPAYFTDEKLFRFVIYNSLLENDLFPYLPEVAFHPFRRGTLINGSLWSLAYEFSCYAIVLVFGVLHRLNGRTAAALLAFTLLSLTFRMLSGYLWFVSYFAAGMCMYFLRKRHRLNGWIACLAGFVILVGNYGPIPWAVFPVLGAYFVIYVAADAQFEIGSATRFGDLSYGIYLYGWPCQQVAVYVLGGKPPWWQIFALALPSAAALAWISWHAVERPMLRWKDTRLSGLPQRVGVGTALVYAASAIIFGIGKMFLFASVLPAALALAGGQIVAWVQPGLRTLRVWSWIGVPFDVIAKKLAPEATD